jgi:hypothetical protein
MFTPEENIDDSYDIFGDDDGVYEDEEDYFEGDYPDEKTGERSQSTIYIDELDGVDFSSLDGDFKSSLKKLSKAHDRNETKIKKIIAPSNRTVIVEGKSKIEEDPFFEAPRKLSARIDIKKKKVANKRKIVNTLKLNKDWGVNKRATIYSDGPNAINRVLVPRDRRVIVEGVQKFILSEDCSVQDYKSIGYCNGKKLKEMVFTINNEGSNDFTIELFNPSTPLDYYQATTQNVNDKIVVAGSNVANVQYTDVLSNMMSNPTKIYNSKVVITAPSSSILFNQRAQNFRIIQKDITAVQDIHSINIDLMLDAFQSQNNIVAFSYLKELNRPYIPDGMDVLRYTVLAGCTVSIAFYYEQKKLKKFFYKEIRDNKLIL